jgi:hypothetical protein
MLGFCGLLHCVIVHLTRRTDMDTKDMSDPERDSAPTDATAKPPRTDINDLPAPAGELTAEEAEQVVGGLVVPAIIAVPIGLPSPQHLTSMRAYTTGGNPYPDQDTVSDRE